RHVELVLSDLEAEVHHVGVDRDVAGDQGDLVEAIGPPHRLPQLKFRFLHPHLLLRCLPPPTMPARSRRAPQPRSNGSSSPPGGGPKTAHAQPEPSRRMWLGVEGTHGLLPWEKTHGIRRTPGPVRSQAVRLVFHNATTAQRRASILAGRP